MDTLLGGNDPEYVTDISVLDDNQSFGAYLAEAEDALTALEFIISESVKGSLSQHSVQASIDEFLSSIADSGERVAVSVLLWAEYCAGGQLLSLLAAKLLEDGFLSAVPSVSTYAYDTPLVLDLWFEDDLMERMRAWPVPPGFRVLQEASQAIQYYTETAVPAG